MLRKLNHSSIPGRKMTNTTPKGAKIEASLSPISGTIPVYTCCASVPGALTLPSGNLHF